MITLRVEAITDEIRAEVAAAFDGSAVMRLKTDTSAGMVDAVDCLDGAEFVRVLDDGAPVAFVVVRMLMRRLDARVIREAEISLAHGRAAFDLTAEVLPMLEEVCRNAGARGLSIVTRRGGLIKKMESRGYGRTAVRLRKELS